MNEPATISHAVDKQRLGPERAWPGDVDLRQRRNEEGGAPPIPRYLPGYTWDVSHLVV